MERLLLVEDDERLARRVAGYLVEQGFEVGVEHRGGPVLPRLQSEDIAVVVLDWMLPDIQGVELCPLIKRTAGPSGQVPAVLMLTARHGDHSEVEGLDAGADDYLTKPVRPAVLLARIRALLRRTNAPAEGPEPPIDLGEVRLDPGRRAVEVDGVAVPFTAAEFDLLHLLMKRAGEVLSRDALSLSLRGIAHDGVDRTLDIRVSRVRRKLGPRAGARLKGVRGAGYLFTRPS